MTGGEVVNIRGENTLVIYMQMVGKHIGSAVNKMHAYRGSQLKALLGGNPAFPLVYMQGKSEAMNTIYINALHNNALNALHNNVFTETGPFCSRKIMVSVESWE